MELNGIHNIGLRRQHIQERLDEFVYNRAATLSAAVVTAFIAYLAVLKSSDNLTTTAVVLAAIGVVLNVLRIALAHTAGSEPDEAKRSKYRFRFQIVTIASSAVWLGIYVQANAAVGNSHPANFIALLIISGLIGGTPSSLGPMQRLATANILILGITATVSTLVNGANFHDYVFAGLAVIYAVLMIKYSDDFKTTLSFAIMERGRFESEMVSIKTLINSFPGHITLLDQDLKYVMVNDAFHNSVTDNVIGHRIGYMSDSNDFKILVENFANSSQENEIKEMRMGPIFDRQHYLVSLSKIHSPFEGIAILTMNIEDRVQMELELAKNRQDMEHASRLVTIGEMVSSISHEIRNPLTIIAGKASYFKILAAKGPLDINAVTREADVIIKMVDRISKIIQTTLRFSRGDKDSQLKPVALGQVIEDATALTASKIKIENVTLHVTQDRALEQTIECHPLQISQVIVNLINNAIDAMEGQSEKWIAIDVKDCGDKFKIIVSDGGPGIPADLKEKIMQPFFTTKPADKGTGLGLSISQNIMANHMGDLKLLPEEKNTTFVIEMWKRAPDMKAS